MAVPHAIGNNPFLYGQGCIPIVLRTNPTIRDKALAGVVEANLIGFTGSVEVKTKVHPFATGNKQARAIYITPYGNVKDFFVSLKRIFAGVQFAALVNDGADITGYVLGVLGQGTAAYRKAQQETDEALRQGRRFSVIIATDCSNISISLDQDQGCVLI